MSEKRNVADSGRTRKIVEGEAAKIEKTRKVETGKVGVGRSLGKLVKELLGKKQ